MKEGPIRVLCVFSTLGRGGAESMCMNLYRRIDRTRVQFDFVKHTGGKGAFEDEIGSLGGRIFTAPEFRGYNLFAYRAWWKEHLTRHPEHRIVHGHYFTVSKYYFTVCRKMGRFTIGHAHTAAYARKNYRKLLMIHGLENACDARLACSEDAGKFFYPHKEFTVLRNAIDADKFAYDPQTAREVREVFGLGGGPVLGVVGTVKRIKNPLGTVGILQAVSRRRPETRLLWAGSDGGMKQEVVRQLEELGLADRVVFTGVRPDVHRLLQAMDVFLMPSLAEGLPVSLIEAQAAGLPCFVSDAVTREADITGLCRFLPLEDWERWADGILEERAPRTDTRRKIMDAGYDISTTAAWLQDFYLKNDPARRSEA